MTAAEEALAHCKISSLLARYYQAIDVGDLDTFASEVLSEDATWEMIQKSGPEQVVDTLSGRTEILAWFRRMLSGGVSMSEGTVRHFINTHVIEIDRGGRSGRSTSHLQAVDTASMQILANGFVEASHVLTEAGWRIRRYRVEESITEKDMRAIQALSSSSAGG